MAIQEKQLTKDGFEMQLGTNHFGHLFTNAARKIESWIFSRRQCVNMAHRDPRSIRQY